MPRLITPTVLALALLPGCASSPKARAIQTSAGITQAAEVLADAWDPYVDAQIAKCREKVPHDADPIEKKECLGLAGHPDEMDEAVDTVAAIQTTIKVAVMCELPDAPQLRCDGTPDWRALTFELLDAWSVLLPYLKAVEGE